MSWADFCKFNKVSQRFSQVELAKCDRLSKKQIEQGLEWCKSPRNLVLTGKTGRGKTHFAHCLAREIVNTFGLSKARWFKSKVLDDKIIESINKYGDASYIIETISETPILFIDDFGVDRGTERSERDFYHILDQRWDHARPTVISTNLDAQLIEKTYGSRISSRLRDFKWMLFEGPDLRGEN